MSTKKREWVRKLHDKLIKKTDVEEHEVLDMLHDIVTYLKVNNNRLRTTQQLIGIENVFQGYIVINWFDTDKTFKYRSVNKIIVKECVMFYNKCWLQRNEILHSKDIQHDFITKWYKKTKWYGESIGGEALKFIDQYKIDETKDSNRTIKEQIRKVQYYVKN